MGLDMYSVVSNMFSPVFSFLRCVLFFFMGSVFLALLAFLLFFLVRYHINPFRVSAKSLEMLSIKFKPYELMRWLLWDFLTRKERSALFKPYGFTFFIGRQGSGKTISMVQYLNTIKKKYPNCIIVTNFAYAHADHRMTDWRDFFEIRNGTNGVIFAIDEIHSEYSSAAWKDFPENLLSEISQQRKQKVKIISTSQVLSRVAKPLREQAFSVVVCETFFGRYTRNREYDCAEFMSVSENLFKIKKKLKTLWKSSFVQSNDLRNCYDTFEKIEQMKKIEFIPRNERY